VGKKKQTSNKKKEKKSDSEGGPAGRPSGGGTLKEGAGVAPLNKTGAGEKACKSGIVGKTEKGLGLVAVKGVEGFCVGNPRWQNNKEGAGRGLWEGPRQGKNATSGPQKKVSGGKEIL